MSTNEFVDLSAVTNSDAYHRHSSGVGSYTNVHGMTDTWPTLNNPYVPKVESRPPAGFPQDDEYSIQQGCPTDSANLDIYYAHQFIDSETHFNPGAVAVCQYPLEYTPIINGTLTGSIVLLIDPDLGVWATSQTFVFNADGTCDLQTVLDDEDVLAIGGTLNQMTGEMVLTFSESPGEHKITVSYEFNAEPINLDPVGGFEEVDQMAQYAQGGEAKPVWGNQGEWSTFQNQDKNPNKNSSSYIDYLVNQLADTKAQLYDAEEKLAAIHKENGGNKTLPELEVEMYNEYDKKLKEQREFMISKLDQYLKLQVKSEDDLKKMASRPTVEIFEEAIQS